jgi:hypothetical protein
VLATARRLLRSELAPGLVDAGFIAEHRAVLGRHPEVPDELLDDPDRALRALAGRNLELMAQALR